jgi:hypothetical protein
VIADAAFALANDFFHGDTFCNGFQRLPILCFEILRKWRFVSGCSLRFCCSYGEEDGRKHD